MHFYSFIHLDVWTERAQSFRKLCEWMFAPVYTSIMMSKVYNDKHKWWRKLNARTMLMNIRLQRSLNKAKSVYHLVASFTFGTAWNERARATYSQGIYVLASIVGENCQTGRIEYALSISKMFFLLFFLDKNEKINKTLRRFSVFYTNLTNFYCEH